MDLKLEAKQTQTLSQHMIQSAKILQMTAQELNTYVSDLALENPVIDITEPDAGGRQESIEQQWLNSFNEENYYLYQRQNNDDDYDFRDSWNIDSTDGETLQDYLWSQLVAENFSEEDTEIIKFMLECLDNKGYLSESVESVAAYFHTDEQRIEALLKLLQELDPAGVCARNLEECLRLQLTRRQLDTPVLLSLVDTCLELVAKNQIPAIARKLRLTAAEAAGCCQIIKSLNPKPGVSFSSRDQLRYIIPDVTIVKFKDHFDILLNESMYPGIGINSYYRQMSQNPESPEVREYLTTKLRQAEWVKQCIAQRSKTLMQVSRAILAHQEEFRPGAQSPGAFTPGGYRRRAGHPRVHGQPRGQQKISAVLLGRVPHELFLLPGGFRGQVRGGLLRPGHDRPGHQAGAAGNHRGRGEKEALQRPDSRRKAG
jgi:RNA polymerase sigma-54 factor